MALIKCRECSKQISDKANACPHCGCPLKGGTVASAARCARCGGSGWAGQGMGTPGYSCPACKGSGWAGGSRTCAMSISKVDCIDFRSGPQ